MGETKTLWQLWQWSSITMCGNQAQTKGKQNGMWKVSPVRYSNYFWDIHHGCLKPFWNLTSDWYTKDSKRNGEGF